MLKRYIGPFAVASVSAGGRNLGSVEKGEAIYIPDDLVNSVGWPELSWEDVTSTSNKDNKENE